MENSSPVGWPLSIAGLSDTGKARQNNEDYIGYHVPQDEQVLGTRGILLVVCDGVGGGVSGEVASEHAVRRILNAYYQQGPQPDPESLLAAAIRQANSEIYNENLRRGGDRKMATTVVAVTYQKQEFTFIHAGDSRAYLVREGQIRQVTKDHSWVAEMVASGDLTPEEAEEHPWRNRITRSLGVGESVKLDASTVEAREGDAVVLCTDGLTRHVTDEEIATIVTRYPPAQAVQQLIDLGNSRGGSDNLSVIVATVGKHGSDVATVVPPAMAEQTTQPAPYPAPSSIRAGTPGKGTSPVRYGLYAGIAVLALIALAAIAFLALRGLRGVSKEVSTSTPTGTATATKTVDRKETALLEAETTDTVTAPSPTATATVTPEPTSTPEATPTTAAVQTGSLPSVTPTPANQEVSGTVIISIGVNLRTAPSANANISRTLSRGTTFNVLAWAEQTSDSCFSGLWLHISTHDDASEGWICGDRTIASVEGEAASAERLSELGVPEAAPENGVPSTAAPTATPRSI